MRRLTFAGLALASIALLAAGPPPGFLTIPRVIVFPFQVSGSILDRETSARLETVVANQIAEGGAIKIVPVPSGTDRKDYLTAARAAGADYYVTGFVSPLGDGATMVDQVVSTHTGIVVFSSSGQLQTFGDAAGQGDNLRVAIQRHAGRNLNAFSAPPPTSATPTAAPTAGAEAKLSGGLFRRRRPAAAPSPSPSASPA